MEIVRRHIPFYLFFHFARFHQEVDPPGCVASAIHAGIGISSDPLLALAFHKPFQSAQLLAATTLHPITATIAGFLLAGAVEAGGGFAAAGRLLSSMGKGFLGLSGTVVLLVNIPTLLAMPCGRIWAATLIPAAMMFGFDLARQQKNLTVIPIIVFGLIVNASASCAPSPLGGLGMMGEGTAGFGLHSFSKPLQIAIMVITMAAMAVIGSFYKMPVNAKIVPAPGFAAESLPWMHYLTFLFYVVGLGIVFVLRPPVPIQTILLAMTILIMMVCKVSLKKLIGGIILHPITAMIAGFIMGGALLVAGGFDILIQGLSWFATHSPLGFIGVSVIFVFLPAIFPMPCGRIIVSSFLPGVILFGETVSRMTGSPLALPAILIGFILCGAASCGPSPLGGLGGIGEGNLGLEGGISSMPQQFGILLGVPVAALLVRYVGLSTVLFQLPELFVALGAGAVFGIVVNVLLGYRFYKPGGILGGLLAGSLIAVL
ncbi:MAG: hypothetical protein ABSH41_12910 [Syntrophobacteraceae bacterium]